MKKNLAFVLVLVVLTVSGISLGNVKAVFTPTPDTPYAEDATQFFESTDPCGYVMGVATPYPTSSAKKPNSGTVKFTPQGNNVQGCFNASGYAYSDGLRDSRATYSYTTDDGITYTDYTIDFVGSGYQTVIDQTTGVWSGWGRITDGTIPSAQRWVKFDWTCSTPACTADSASKYYVRTNLTTGAVSGYAWSDYFNKFIQFTGLTQELPPKYVEMYVDVLSSDGSTGPGDVTPVDAPIADGYDYWRVRVELADGSTYLGPDDVTSLTITPHATGTVYLNQVEDTGDAIVESDFGTEMLDPSTGLWSSCSTTGSCVLTEADTGATSSWNTFIRSSSPTSNMLGLQNDSDTAIDSLGDREGCRWIYYDQWHNVDSRTVQTSCGSMAAWYYKADYFYNRVNNRNQYILDTLTIDVTFAAANTSINTNTYTTHDTSTQYTYAVHDSAGTPSLELSWRPRYQLTDFSAIYDAAAHDQISSDTLKNMTLQTTATVSDTSEAFFQALGLRRPGYAVKYQLEVDKGTSEETGSDLELLVDTTTDGIADCTRRTDTVVKSYGTSGVPYKYNGSYTMKYGQKDAACGGVLGVPTNTVSEPTAEQWVCDNLSGDASLLPNLSCYFTGYLSRIDRHDQPEDMLVIGAINSSIAQEDFLNNDSSLSVLGATDAIKLRNKMFAEIVRDIRGLTPSSSTAELNGSMVDGSRVMESLLGGRLLYTEGDIVVDGSSSFSDMTIVTVGGNVILKGNVTGGRLGIIAFKNTAGDGGNVYVDPDVTELYTNMFLDGALLSYDGVTVPSAPVEFSWSSTELREATLLKQLYLNGSVFSHNTVNAAPESSATSTSWNVGDGTTTMDYNTAREHDLNMLRQYRRCFVVDASGMLTTTLEDCNEGEQPRTAYGTANGLYNSFILDYSPADELPIFRAQSGLFQ